MIRTMQLEMNESRSIGAALYCTSDSVKQATRQTRVLTFLWKMLESPVY